MAKHHEVGFEEVICDRLAGAGWLYTPKDAEAYDRARALFPADVVDWVKASQPAAWASLTKSHGAAAEAALLDRIRKQLDVRGTLDVLRRGVEKIGLNASVSLAQFRPAMAMSADLVAKYQANRLRVVRQVRYSLANENCIDLVLFLNGLPMSTVEQKTDFTQSVQDAVANTALTGTPVPRARTRNAFWAPRMARWCISQSATAK